MGIDQIAQTRQHVRMAGHTWNSNFLPLLPRMKTASPQHFLASVADRFIRLTIEQWLTAACPEFDGLLQKRRGRREEEQFTFDGRKNSSSKPPGEYCSPQNQGWLRCSRMHAGLGCERLCSCRARGVCHATVHGNKGWSASLAWIISSRHRHGLSIQHLYRLLLENYLSGFHCTTHPATSSMVEGERRGCASCATVLSVKCIGLTQLNNQ